MAASADGGRRGFGKRLKALSRMAAVRLSAVFLLLFAVFALVLVVYVNATASNILLSQSRQAISDEIEDIDGIYQAAGIIGLVQTIAVRSRQPGASLYLLTDPLGRILAGNVQSLAAGVLDREGYISEPFFYQRFGEKDGGQIHRAVAQIEELPNGMHLLIGRDQGDEERFNALVKRTVIFALALMTAGALAAWLLVGRRALRRIDRMSEASARIMAGDLSERLPVTGAGDEFDRLSDNLNRLLARIALLQEGQRQVSDSIAHDLKTPLTRLRNRAEAALGDSPESTPQRAALEGMIGEADQMIRTFDALLMISRVEAGFHPAMMTRVDLGEIVADVAELYEPLAEEAGAKLVVGECEPVMSEVSRELLAQALSNLIDNALKYAQPAEGPTRITLSLARQDDHCQLSVVDNGAGIPEDKRERVLERFFRLDQSRSKPGSGLGLSLVQAIAQLHGGRVVLGDAGPGLRITLDLPIRGGTEAHERKRDEPAEDRRTHPS
ncbi:sensor histidine kinase [Consotaella salsifontis]|uniref:histidine kinase n=1 Tax=Consotaella salsifontis TaxID=1365950 RepID=A0A1T4SX75_9HYPH|nr:HAMP domain-containing sensor histidine kinase [Consotaella salsifontis]SKA32528.1 Signal transduction histidine kinase [Consotaella salsifontis]